MDHSLFFYLTGVPVLGLAAQWLAWRLRVPSILLLLIGGVGLGFFVKIDDLLLNIANSDQPLMAAQILFPIVSLSVAVILFEGGLSLKFSELHESGSTVLRLVTLGALISWVLTSVAASFLLGLDYRLAILLGAILVVTGPTVVAPMIRHIRPTRIVASIVKWEGIVVDPIGAILAVLVFETMFHSSHSDQPIMTAACILVLTALIGGVFGTVIGWLLTLVVKKFWIPDHLHGVLFLASALGSFAISNFVIEESGLVTVTVLGIYLANKKAVSLDHIVQFKENLGVILISCLFIVLGSRLDLASLADNGAWRFLFLVVLIAVIRPASVLLGSWGTTTHIREKLLVSALAPRGIVAAAVASVFSLKIIADAHSSEDMLALATQADTLVPITFLVIVGTVTFYGLTSAPLARYLGLADSNPQGMLIAGAEDWIQKLAHVLEKAGVPVVLVDTNYRNVSEARMAGLRAYCSSILSENIEESADLSGVGRLLAMTGNDEVNVLATREYAHLFGKANVYQLTPNNQSSGVRGSVKETKRGRDLFGGGLNQRRLAELVRQGYEMKATKLTEAFTLDQFRMTHGNEAKILFLIDGPQKVQISLAGETMKSDGVQTLIALIPPKAPEN